MEKIIKSKYYIIRKWDELNIFEKMVLIGLILLILGGLTWLKS